MVRVVRLPHRNGRSPVAVAADRPVARALEPLAELAVLDVLRRPGDLLVVREQIVLEVRDAHEPARDRHIDQRVAAAPAVRVAVLVRAQPQQPAVLAQQPHDGRVRIRPQLARDIRNHIEETAVSAERDDRRDAVRLVHAVVILTVGRLVHDAGAVAGGDVVVGDDLPGVLRSPRLDVGEVVEQRLVGHARKLRAADPGPDGGGRLIRLVVAELTRVGGDLVGRQQ